MITEARREHQDVNPLDASHPKYRGVRGIHVSRLLHLYDLGVIALTAVAIYVFEPRTMGFVPPAIALVYITFSILLNGKANLGLWRILWFYYGTFILVSAFSRLTFPQLIDFALRRNAILFWEYTHGGFGSLVQGTLLWHALTMVVIGLALLLSGGRVSTREAERYGSPRARVIAERVIVYLVIVAGIGLYNYAFFFRGDVNAAIDFGIFGYLTLFARDDVATWIGIFFLLHYGEEIGRNRRMAIVGLIGLLVLPPLMAGSRGAIIRLLTAVLFFYVRPGQHPYATRRAAFTGAALLVVALALFPVVTAVKFAGGSLPSAISGEMVSYDQLLNRLNYLDYSVLVNDPERFRSSNFVTLESDLAFVVNKLVPGGAIVSGGRDAAQYFKADFRGLSESSLRQYHSDVLLIVDMPLMYVGRPQSLVLLFVLFLALGRAFSRTRQLTSDGFVAEGAMMMGLELFIQPMSVGRLIYAGTFILLNYVLVKTALGVDLRPRSSHWSGSARRSIA